MLNEEQHTSHEGTITITTGPVRMAAVAGGATMMLTGIGGLIVSVLAGGGLDVRSVITAALIALVFAGLVMLLYGAIAAHAAVMRHQATLRREIEDAADARHRQLTEQVAALRETVDQQAATFAEFLEHLTELSQAPGDELGPRRIRNG